MNLGRGDRDQGEARFLLPDSKDSASTKWMKHYLPCSVCNRGESSEKDMLCARGAPLRAAAIAEMKAIPKQQKNPTSTVFNPAMKGHR